MIEREKWADIGRTLKARIEQGQNPRVILTASEVLELIAEVERLKRERDEARRKICADYAIMTGNTRYQEAAFQGWSYLYESEKSDE